MKGASHGSRSPRWLGNPIQYQLEAHVAYANHYDRPVLPTAWITTDCNDDLCLVPECMTLHQPRRIDYPQGVCTYCGDPAGSDDHLLPKPVTGLTLRRLVAVVPACGNCNSRLGDYPNPNISDRRRKVQLRLEQINRMLLLRPIKPASELSELGPALRSVGVKNNNKTLRVKARLAWPLDPHYDVRAFQRSGIEDPVALGLCDPFATPLRAEYVTKESA